MENTMPEYADVGAALTALSESVDVAKLKGMDATMLFDISGEQGGQWTVTVKDGHVDVKEESTGPTPLTIEATSKDVMALLNGQLNPMAAFMQGRLKVKGDMSMAMQLQKLFG
jgi:putative sterol carrier protein